ncbi:hypothetical protein DFQ45_10641 [Thiopseudomonas denitrificans]|uniref:Uncharacterized protein n=1 Tax=Thiopseudomonas denitrificans TaxID=1501432 RepID=A0A4R6U0K5_9GAMM|nr:hypothetical protein DFQ45_10641 [Thiopseudomonas denitrificans]
MAGSPVLPCPGPDCRKAASLALCASNPVQWLASHYSLLPAALSATATALLFAGLLLMQLFRGGELCG